MNNSLISITNEEADNSEIEVLLARYDGKTELDRLAGLVHSRLMRRGAIHSASLILMAQDLFIIYTYRLWEVAGYTSFPEWVASELEPQPWGCSYTTTMALINIWRVYHVGYGWSIEEMALAGKAKLERGAATAQVTAVDGNIDEDLRDSLLDSSVTHRNVLEDYRDRKAARETRKRLASGEMDNAPGIVAMPDRLYQSPVYEADSRTGLLVVWVPVDGKDLQSLAIPLGKLNFISDNAQPWLATLLSRAGVRVR